MKALYLLRHAKSSWSNASISDHERPLAPRGRRAAVMVAAHLREAGIRPALVLCSTARRARETLDAVAPSLGDDVDVWMEDDLYGSDERELLGRLQRLPAAVPSAMVIGHNPGLQGLALELVGSGEDAAVARLEQKFPTAALATLLVSGAWPTLGPGGATLAALVVPRELG